ncbi:22419_t:CDS:1 [Cetraspora pellucida]|uniref:22419_t:CDS:1 n=1 Tax=Cetraspora pellucida TaxID=1433469 RepID=A0A9N9CYG0_9GLOM|nr:22419_t:CDS:1 [Cetraspora pellucida]
MAHMITIYISFLIIILIYSIFLLRPLFDNFEDSTLHKEFRSSNRTLSFDHIYVIHLDHRTDRLEKLNELSSYLGLDLDYFTAVSRYNERFLRKFGTGNMNPSQKACYLSHHLIYRQIIDKGYKSALILEDDVDFELNITAIMADIHHELPLFWDVLYVGHCNERKGELVGNSSYAHKLYKSMRPACMHAYAVSYFGVRKLVEMLDPVVPITAIDNSLPDLISNKKVTSYSVHPQAIAQWKAADNPSDIPTSWSTHHSLLNSTLHFLGYKGDNGIGK